jgi:hypothetical protein
MESDLTFSQVFEEVAIVPAQHEIISEETLLTELQSYLTNMCSQDFASLDVATQEPIIATPCLNTVIASEIGIEEGLKVHKIKKQTTI